MKQVLMVVSYNFHTWNKNLRVIMSFFVALIFCFLLSDKVVQFAEKVDTSMQILEPFIWTFDDSRSILLTSMILIFLFADMPFVTNATPFFLMRTSRKRWLLGQMVYIVLATMLYLVFVLVTTCLLSMKQAFLGNQWSPTAVVLGYSKAGEVLAVPSVVKTMGMSTPIQCAGMIFLLLLLYSLSLVSFMLLCNLRSGKVGGVLAAFGFSIVGFLLDPEIIQSVFRISEYEAYRVNALVGWLSPLNHATLHMHNFGYDLLPSLWQSCLISIGFVMLCFAAGLSVIRNYPFTFTGTGGK